MKILVLNCGSSSLKYQLINSETEEVLAKGLCERIGIDGSVLTHQPAGKDKIKTEIFNRCRFKLSESGTYGRNIIRRRGTENKTCYTDRQWAFRCVICIR